MKRSSNRSVATRLRALLLTLGLVLMGVVGVAGPASAADNGDILPPFDVGTTWNVCQGYNSGTHTGTSAYGLDLTGSGCDNSAAGRTVRAPISGTVYYYQSLYGNLCVNIAGGRSYTLTHITSSVTSGTVSAGQAVGTVGAAGSYNNNGVAHIHFELWGTANCYSSSGIPFDSAHGTQICGAPDLTASGPSGGNGTWSGTSFTGQSCDDNSDEIEWKLRNHKSAGAPDASFYYGANTGKPVVGDWDGNGSESIGVVRDNGSGDLYWQLRYSNTAGIPSITATYGASTDTPIVGNWDGVGTTTIGIVRNDGSGQLLWKLSNDNGTTYTSFYYGASTDIPVVGDWDGNGTTTIGIARKDTASGQLLWKLRNSNSAGTADVSFYYGAITAKPVPGDWDGNGTVTAGTVRSDYGGGQLYWQLRDSNSAGTPGYEFYYGASTDTPVVGSWGGAGAMNVGIARG